MDYTNSEEVHEAVKKYYGEVLDSNEDLKTSCCTSSGTIHPKILNIINHDVPEEILLKYYGCGTCIPLGIEGLKILDLGSGTGRDCYVCSKLVGEKGEVIGIDMTDKQLEIANKYVNEFTKERLFYEKPNLKFFKGYIESLDEIDGLKEKENQIDICISNCVVNLSPDKEKVLKGVFKLLKKGGEMYFSDVYCSRRLPDKVRKDPILHGECISGALYVNDFLSLCKKVGFKDPRVVSKKEIKINDLSSKLLLGESKFYSITYRLFKLDNLEDNCEDYGQIAIYNGKMDGYPHLYELDDHHKFEKNKPVLVCGNTASMLSETWLGKYFKIIGDRTEHFGQFPCEKGNCDNENNNDCGNFGCCC